MEGTGIGLLVISSLGSEAQRALSRVEQYRGNNSQHISLGSGVEGTLRVDLTSIASTGLSRALTAFI
jgi:hypothetical protein